MNKYDSTKRMPGTAGEMYNPMRMLSRFVDAMAISGCGENSAQLHSHSFYELICCRSAGGAEYLVGSERYRLQKGDIIMIAPDISHKPIVPEGTQEPYVRDVLRLSTEMMAELSRMDTEETPTGVMNTRLLRTGGTQWEYLVTMFRRCVIEAEQRAPGWEFAVAGNTIQLLVHLYRAVLESAEMTPVAEKPELLDRVLAYVESHLSQKITLADVAHQFFVSESTISQTFRNKMGVSFYRCVTQRRLIAAKMLIAEGMMLEFVGQQVGFSDYSTFYRAFKQEYGISPRQYRRTLENAQ